MYETQFGLKRRPFGETVSPSTYVALPSRDAVLRRLRFALEHGQGPAVLFGPPGSGKSLLARRLAGELAGPAVFVSFPALTPVELLLHLVEEFGGSAEPSLAMHAALRHLRAHLSGLAARGSRPLIAIDDAHLITAAETFDALKMLLNFATDGPSDLSLLLVGGAEVLLELPAGLADRLAARCLLGSLTESESASYILGRLAAAGAVSPLFTPAALTALHRLAAGLPRRLNRLADLALLIAYAQERTTIDEAIIAIAAREFQRDMAA